MRGLHQVVVLVERVYDHVRQARAASQVLDVDESVPSGPQGLHVLRIGVQSVVHHDVGVVPHDVLD